MYKINVTKVPTVIRRLLQGEPRKALPSHVGEGQVWGHYLNIAEKKYCITKEPSLCYMILTTGKNGLCETTSN